MNEGTFEKLMDATYCAFCEHGYADLTMQRIVDGSTLSKATHHYYFETKEEQSNAFPDHLVETFERRLGRTPEVVA